MTKLDLQKEIIDLKERIDNQSNTIAEQHKIISNYIDVKAVIASKIKYYETKEKEYGDLVITCSSKEAQMKKDVLMELFEELYIPG